MLGTFQFLGTGASAGVPVIGCKCEVCTSLAPENKRFRPAGVLRVHGKVILIDMGPDFRAQALTFGVDSIDGLLLTHTHYDHIAGIDEARIFNVRQQKALPCLLSQESLHEIRRRYSYFFQAEGTAKWDFYPLEKETGQVDFLGVPIQYCHFYQSAMQVTGFRIGDFAYVSDIRTYEESIFPILKGVHTLVLSALRPEKSPFHLSFEEAIALARWIGAKKTYLTHVGHFLGHEEMNALLPPDIRVAYDGLTLEFQCTKS